MEFFNLFDVELIIATIRISNPIILAALGGLICFKCGVFNIALEGKMLIGSFFGLYFVELTGNTWLGLAGGMVSGVIVSLVFSLFTIKFKADDIITSIAINLFSIGLTGYTLKVVFGISGQYRPKNLKTIENIDLEIINELPFLNNYNISISPITLLTFILIILAFILLYFTNFGLNIRSVGENPLASETCGVSSSLIKFKCIILCGGLCGLAGAHLSTGYVSMFTERMVGGRGFTAFTAMIFGNGHPIYSSLASLLFGFSEALGVRIQLEGFGLPTSILQTFPFVLAIIALTISSAIRMKKIGKMKSIIT